MTRRVVLCEGGDPSLFLEGVRPEEGFPRLGYVVNGAWNWELRDGYELAKDRNYIVRRWPVRDYTIIEVPDDLHGGYQSVMNWAREQLKEP